MNLLVETTVKISLVIFMGLAATAMLRQRSAAVRHWVLTATLGCALSVPVLSLLAPTWSVSLPVSSAIVTTPPEPPNRHAYLGNVGVTVSRQSSLSGSQGAAIAGRTLIGRWLIAIWLAGAAINGAVLFVGLGRLTRIASRARVIRSGAWADLTTNLEHEHGLRRRVRLLQGDHPALLVTWGLLTPRILLPPAAAEWPEGRIRVVLAHEFAHIVRRDWAVQMGAELLRAVYWFHPLVWLACRRLRQESEHACDDAVVNLGVEARDYATHLLELARALSTERRRWVPASAIAARPSSLHMRIRAMLTHSLDRRPVTRFTRAVSVIALLAITVPIAAFAQKTFATVSGTVTDSTDALLPDVTLVLADTQRDAKHEVRSDRFGHFEFVGLPSGDYVLDTSLPGFATQRAKVAVSEDVQRNIKLEVGSLTETVSVSREGSGNGVARAEQRSEKRALPACGAPVVGGIGGQIRAPKKTRDVKPHYPAQLLGSDVAGRVVLAGVIGTNGVFREIHVVSSPHSALASAALDAVSQWEWDETLLNCVPVETAISVRVDFTK